MGFLAMLASSLGKFASKAMSGACWVLWIDEEEMPESLIK